MRTPGFPRERDDDGLRLAPEFSIAELQARFDRGEWTAAALCEAFLQRMAAVDRAGPTLRSVIEINPDALAVAEALDHERRTNGPRGPLHGVPMLVKDSIDTGDRMMTTAGSLAREGNRAPRDAFLVQKLRAAGVVLLGKSNMSEWGCMRSARACSGSTRLASRTNSSNPSVRFPKECIMQHGSRTLTSFGGRVDSHRGVGTCAKAGVGVIWSA